MVKVTERRRSEVSQTALGLRGRKFADKSPACDGSEHCPAHDHRLGCYHYPTGAPPYERDFAVEVGKPLPNGAVVVAAEPNGEYVVVLAVRPRGPGAPGQYVTWKVDPGTGHCYWGNYYAIGEFDEAVANFKERVAK